jgi:hypothetical protein
MKNMIAIKKYHTKARVCVKHSLSNLLERAGVR